LLNTTLSKNAWASRILRVFHAKIFPNANNIAIARHSHTATLLANERLLVAGGNDGTNALSSTEIYGPIPTATMLYGAKKLPDGSFQLSFTNSVGALFEVLATTNLAQPMSHWNSLRGIVEVFSRAIPVY